MAQQQGGSRLPNAYENQSRQPLQADAQQVRRVEYIDNAAQIEAEERARRKKQAQERKRQQRARKRRRRRRTPGGPV